MKRIVLLILISTSLFLVGKAQDRMVKVNLSIEWHKDLERLPQVVGEAPDSLPFLRIEYCNLSDRNIYFSSLHRSEYDIPGFPHMLVCGRREPITLEKCVENAKQRLSGSRNKYIIHNEYSCIQSVDSDGEDEYLNKINELYKLLYEEQGHPRRIEGNFGCFIFWEKNLRRAIRKNRFNRVVFLKAGERYSQYLNLYGLYLAEAEGEFIVEDQQLPDKAWTTILRKVGKCRELPQKVSGHYLYSGIIVDGKVDFRQSGFEKGASGRPFQR